MATVMAATTTATATTTTTSSITLPGPRRKARVKEVPGVAVPTPSILPHPPCTHYEATYFQGHITVRDPKQAAALWRNGYYGRGLEGGGGASDRERRKKKWRLVETNGLKNGKWFKETREEERRRRDFKGGGIGEREMEEDGRGLLEEGMAMNWEEEEEKRNQEDEEMEEVHDKEEDDKRKEKENNLTELRNEGKKEEEKEEERKNVMKEETEDTAENERGTEQKEEGEKDNRKENTAVPTLKQTTDARNRTDNHRQDSEMRESDKDDESDPEPWRTILVLSGDQEASPDHHDPYAYLSLLPEEALFLSYALGCLVLIHEEPPTARDEHRGKRALIEVSPTHEMTIDEMWRMFVRDDPAFPVKYAAFHHFRTQGWVVKAGLKYGVDYVLYPVGPPFYHSQFVVKVHSLWADTLTLDHSLPGHEMMWTTVAMTERLSNHINKTPVMCFVLRPRSATDQRLSLIECLKELKVQTVVLGRWNPLDGSG